MDGAATPSRPRKGYHHGDLKEALKSAALSLVREHGPRGFTLSEAARRAGVSAAAPYRHFADREALLVAVAEEGYRDLLERLRTEAEREDLTLELRFFEMGVAYVRFALDQPESFQVMFNGEVDKGRHPSLLLAADEAGEVAELLLKRLQEENKLPPGDPLVLARPAWALLHGIASLQVQGVLSQARWACDPIQLAREGLRALIMGALGPV